MFTLAHMHQGIRFLKRARNIKKNGFWKYHGNTEEICKAIVRDCWNDTVFQTSTGNFNHYYIRDFCIAVPGLMKLGYKKEVHNTLQYALNIYSKTNILATTIADDKPLHIYYYSPDSLPMLLRCIREAKADDLIEVYKPFFDLQVDYYFDKIFDFETGLVRAGKFSSMKDNVKHNSSCYNNCMLSMLSDELDYFKLRNPFKSYDIKAKIMENLWNGDYFFDDMNKGRYVAGDANTFPFWCNVTDDKKIFKKAITAIQRAGLDKPWPLKYTRENVKPSILFPLNILLPDYETDTIWMHLGLCFLDVVKKFDKKLFKIYINKYTKLIEKHKNFLEIYNPDGSIFIKTLYASDESMIWAAKYLELTKSI